MTLAADASSQLSRVLSRGPCAGKVASLDLPQKEAPKKSDFLGGIREFAVLRAQFFSLWVRRGLGLTQARSLDPTLLDQGLTLVLPGIESESVYTYGMCDGL